MEPTTPGATPTTTPFLHGKRLHSAIAASGAAVAMVLAGLGIAAAQTDSMPATPPSSSAPADGESEGSRRHRSDHTHADHHPHARLSVAAEALGMTTGALKGELLAGSSIAQVAEARGVAVSVVVDALVADRTEVLNAAVDAGRITREQADARIATLPSRMQELVERSRPAGERGRKAPGVKAGPAKIAEALGITVEELKAGREAGRSLATLAAEHGVDPQHLVDALLADAEAKLAQAVTDGKLTQAEAEARRAGLALRVADFVNRTPPADGERRPARPGHRRQHLKANLEVAATALGMTPAELRIELRAGKSLATIAAERDVPIGQVVRTLVADAKDRLAQAVADGKLSQAQADERSAGLEARFTELVSRTPPPQEGARPA